MSEFERGPSKKDVEVALEGITRDIRSLMKVYSPTTAVRIQVISKKLTCILEKYGY